MDVQEREPVNVVRQAFATVGVTKGSDRFCTTSRQVLNQFIVIYLILDEIEYGYI